MATRSRIAGRGCSGTLERTYQAIGANSTRCEDQCVCPHLFQEQHPRRIWDSSLSRALRLSKQLQVAALFTTPPCSTKHQRSRRRFDWDKAVARRSITRTRRLATSHHLKALLQRQSTTPPGAQETGLPSTRSSTTKRAAMARKEVMPSDCLKVASRRTSRIVSEAWAAPWRERYGTQVAVTTCAPRFSPRNC